MNQSDIKFTMSLDTSPAEQKLNQFQSKMKMADAAFDRAVSRNNVSFNVIRNSPDYRGFGFEKFNSYDNPLMNAAKKFETVITSASEKLRLQSERTAARREYTTAYKSNDLAGMQTASEKYDSANQGLKTIRDQEKLLKNITEEDLKQEEITDETKEQSKEYNQHHIKLGKTLTILGLIKAAWEAIKKTIQAAYDRQEQLNKEAGFLSMDPKGALSANVNREYAIFLAGIRHLGKANPLSESALDSALTTIQTAKERAMTGQGIDDKLVIAIQQLNDNFGTKLNAQQLLTGDPNRTNFQILREIADAIEKAFPKLESMDEQTQARMMGYLRDALGPEFINALLSNANLNLRTGESLPLFEKIFAAGSSANTNINVASTTRKITKAGSDVSDAFDIVKDKFLKIVEGPLETILNRLARFLDTLAALMDNPHLLLPQPMADAWEKAGKFVEEHPKLQTVFNAAKKSSELAVKGGAAYLTGGAFPILTSMASSYFNDIAPHSETFIKFVEATGGKGKFNERVNELGKSKSIYDQIAANIYRQSGAQGNFGSRELTEMRREAVLRGVWQAYHEGKISELLDSSDPIIRHAANKLSDASGYGGDFKKFKFAALSLKSWKKGFSPKGSEFATSEDFDSLIPYLFGGLDGFTSNFVNWFERDRMTRQASGGHTDVQEIEVNGKTTTQVIMLDQNQKQIGIAEFDTDWSRLNSAIK